MGKATMRGSAGMSLVEMMVVIAILGIVAAIAVPGMVDLLRDARLAAQSDQLVTSLNTARLEAVKRRTDMTVCAAADPMADTACSAAAADWAKGWIVEDGKTQRVKAVTDLAITAQDTAAKPVTSVVFNGTLGSAKAATTFTLCVSGRLQHQVDVSLSGHVAKRVNTATICE